MRHYICPEHYIPSTYGEVKRDNSKEESRRQRALKASGMPKSTRSLTYPILQWSWEVMTGRRCWYCGKINIAKPV